MLEPSGLYYPNRFARAFFVAMDDVMGQTGLNSLLVMADMASYQDQLPPDNLERQFDFAMIAALNAALEEMYGMRGGRGMALRIGRAAFAQGFKNFGVLRGMGDPAFRALPFERRLEYGLQGLASAMTSFSDQRCTLSQDEQGYLWHSEVCPMAWGRSSDRPLCHMMVGIIQEGLRWASNGYEFIVREISCRAAGADECVFRINKTAIGERP